MAATTFYCICIIHVYYRKNVFMVVHVYSCLLTGIIHSNLYWNYNLEQNWNIREYSSLFIFLEFQESSVAQSLNHCLWQYGKIEIKSGS